MKSHPFIRPAFWLVLAGLALAGAVLLWLSPAEQTLGQGVKVVYLHVALTRAGTLGLYLAGLLGLSRLWLSQRPLISAWMQLISRMALGTYASGFLVSLISQQISWGGIAWQEPRVAAALNVLAVGVIVQVITGWLSANRLRGLLHAGLAGFLIWSDLNATQVLHPGNAISSSGSLAIQLASWGLLALCLLAGAWIVWNVRLSAAAGQHVIHNYPVSPEMALMWARQLRKRTATHLLDDPEFTEAKRAGRL